MRVDEFGLGFPPRALSYQPSDSETTYSLNWLPFGGFVKIFGEDLEDIESTHPDKDRSFAASPWYKQLAVLVAGVTGNMILAYLLLSMTFMLGKTTLAEGADQELTNQRTIVTQVLPESPAATAGLEAGDKLVRLSVGERTVDEQSVTPSAIQELVASATNTPVVVETMQGSQSERATVTPQITEDGERQIGIVMAEVGTLTLPFGQALLAGAETTVNLTKQIAVGLYDFFKQAVSGAADLSQVAGPVGIADLVGDAADRGFAPLLSFAALISIHLALLNLLPFPALDGGRIVFVLAELVAGRPIPPKFARWANGIGMALLLLLMLIVTYNDILRLF